MFVYAPLACSSVCPSLLPACAGSPFRAAAMLTAVVHRPAYPPVWGQWAADLACKETLKCMTVTISSSVSVNDTFLSEIGGLWLLW